MQLVVFTIGTRGDVQPLVALGCGLQAAGYQVRIATHNTFKAFVSSYGLEFAPVAGDPKQLLATKEGQAWLKSGRNPILGYQLVRRLLGKTTSDLLKDAWQACQGADAVLFTSQGFAGSSIAEALGIPGIVASIHPLARTREFPSIYTPQSWRFGRFYNWLTHRITEQAMWIALHKPFNRWREKTLQLEPYPKSGPFDLAYKQQIPHLYGYSPLVVPTPRDWPEWIHVTGYWFLDPLPDWQPPQSLVDFLSVGPPPVLFGFGSMYYRNMKVLTAVILEAVEKMGVRAILLTGWNTIEEPNLPDNIYALEAVPHSWLLPQVSLMVHHGGAGTTGACLAAGIPGVVIPFLGTQNYWGGRVAALGVGPEPIRQQQLTATKLAAAINNTLSDNQMQHRAAQLGQHIRNEDGIARAISVVERLLN